ncbi:hypothetical protein HN682_08240 [Candidatus Peregrinibacteria bacterium]|jgi:uncharacterized phage protein (TIGR01671 family)|nr:hypothetical protein [Candidatus Peregrinibacteria bacterium]
MRQIKFRAWDKEEEGMVTPNAIIFDASGGVNNLRVGMMDYVSNLGAITDFALMQYTGLKDKNGVEIYELMEINNKYRVIYKAPKFVLQDISNGDIIGYDEQNTYEITGEYSPMEED